MRLWAVGLVGVGLLAGCNLGAARRVLPDPDRASFVAAGDLNADGVADLVAVGSNVDSDGVPFQGVTVLMADGAGGYTPAVYGEWDPNVASAYDEVTLVDVDTDGDLDVVVTVVLPRMGWFRGVAVGINDGTGALSRFDVQFLDGVSGAFLDTAVGDVDGDADPDLVVVETTQLSVRLGDGSGRFGPAAATPLPASFGPRSALVDDVDGDGQNDLVVGGAVVNAGTGLEEAHVAVLLGDGAGGHLAPVSYPTDPTTAGATALTAADLDGDGVRDIVAGNGDEYRYDPDASVSALLGVGDGTFGPAVTTPMDDVSVLAVDTADMDGDSLPDVAVAVGDDGAFVLFGDGSGALRDAHFLLPGSWRAADLSAVDLDGDGVPDVVTAGAKLNIFPNRLDGDRTPHEGV